jgi:hypothetical protein
MGYDSAWVPDSQMIYSDTYAVLALAAANTSRIRLGPALPTRRRLRRCGISMWPMSVVSHNRRSSAVQPSPAMSAAPSHSGHKADPK